MTLYRFAPTAARATELRAALVAVGVKARVARQRYALRIVADNDTDIMIAAAAARTIGFAGPCGGDIARSANSLFAYDFGGAA